MLTIVKGMRTIGYKKEFMWKSHSWKKRFRKRTVECELSSDKNEENEKALQSKKAGFPNLWDHLFK